MTRNTAVEITHSVKFVSQRAMTVFIALASFSNKSDTCFPAIGTIAERCGLSERSVQRAIADLISMQLVAKIVRFRADNGYTSNLYTLVNPLDCDGLSDGFCQADTWAGDSLSPQEYDNSFNTIDLSCSMTDGRADIDESKTETENMSAAANTQIKGPTVKANVPAAPESKSEITLDKVLTNCELDYIPCEYRQIFRDAVTRLYYSEYLRIGKNIRLPQNVIRESLNYLNYHTLEAAIRKIEDTAKHAPDIRNSSQYVTVLLYNAISETDSDLQLKLLVL